MGISRELKFKAWANPTKQMFVNLLDLQYWLHIGYPVMQYTGLKDSHDKEIYESDLIKVPEMIDDDTDGLIEEWIGKVVFTCGSFMIQHPTINQWEDIDISGLEVIGNIYENKELLK